MYEQKTAIVIAYYSHLYAVYIIMQKNDGAPAVPSSAENRGAL